MAKKAEEKEVKKRPKALLKVYLVNGAHFDIPVDPAVDPKDAAERLAEKGIWGAERAGEFFYPPSQLFRIRIKLEE